MSETPEQKELNDSLEQIKEELKNIDMNFYKILKIWSFTDFKDEVENMSEVDKKDKGIKILNIVDNILNFT